MERSEYIAYLRSDEWKEKRKEFLELANYQCQECGKTKTLEVHHLNYSNVGDESDEDVEVLCADCHEDKHLEDGKDDYGGYGEY